MFDFVTVKDLAERFGVDRSNVLKYAKAKKIVFTPRRFPDVGNQKVHTLSLAEAETFCKIRQADGYVLAGSPKLEMPTPAEMWRQIQDLQRRLAAVERSRGTGS